MIIIIGLGNPGKEFEKTPHNAGFMALNLFASDYDFGNFELEKKILSDVIKSKNIILVKPHTFMNNSGKAVKKLIDYFKLRPENLVVVHDDIDLPLGKIKFSKNSGSGGHKGVESVMRAVKTKDFVRLRIGIAKTRKKVKAEIVVLKNFSKNEEQTIKKTIKKASEALKSFVEKGLYKTMSTYNS